MRVPGNGHGLSRAALWLRWLPAAGQAAFIFYLSSLEGEGAGGEGRFDFLPFHDLFFFDKIGHVGLYMLLGAALLLGFRSSPKENVPTVLHPVSRLWRMIPGRRGASSRVSSTGKTWGPAVYPAVLLMGIFYAMTDELHQIWVNGRTASAYDFMADAVGVFAACALDSAYRKIKIGKDQ